MDLVEWQLRVASGLPLPITEQAKVPLFGHAMEARIYAEDPDNNFLPGSGNIKVLRTPVEIENQVRIDTGVRQGDTITTFYDPMISKLIVHAPNRNEAIRALYSALDEYKVVGLPTNIKFLKRVLLNKDFKDWDFDTSFIALNEDELIGVKASKTESDVIKAQVAIANVWLNHQRTNTQKDMIADPWRMNDNFRINSSALRRVDMLNG
jgi:3-methylcrotonyl-CoA carboxylase alpha subunit